MMWDFIKENSEVVIIIIGVIYTLICIYEKIGTIFKEKKLEFIMHDHVVRRENAPDWYDDYTCISIENKGKRSVVIKEWKIVAKNKVFIFLENEKSISPKLPYTLAVDEKVNLEILFDDMAHILNEAIAKGLIVYDEKIVFNIEDGSGKIYKIKSSEKVKWFITYHENALSNNSVKAKRLKKSILSPCNVVYMDYMNQITYLLFLKIDDMRATYVNEKTLIPNEFRWHRLENRSGADLVNQYNKTLDSLSKMDGIIGAIYKKAQNKINDPDNLKRLVSLIDAETWLGLYFDHNYRVKANVFYNGNFNHKSAAYENLLANNERERNIYAGRCFTPRPLIKAIVDVMRPSSEMKIIDPACGTGGFLLAAYDYMKKQTNVDFETKSLKIDGIFGGDINPLAVSLCTMNLYLHGIGGNIPAIKECDSLINDDGLRYDMILANPPFGKKISNIMGECEYKRKDFIEKTAHIALNFLQYIMTMLKSNGRTAVVVLDNVLFEHGAGENIRKRLLNEFNLHTILRLPIGIFYDNEVNANVLFFDAPPALDAPSVLANVHKTNNVWIYDCRTNNNLDLLKKPLIDGHLKDFVKCYCADDVSKRKESKRFRKYIYDDIIKRDRTNLDIAWLKDKSLKK